MIEAFTFSAAYLSSAGAIGAGMARLSPTIGPRLRAVFSASAPMAAGFLLYLGDRDSVVIDGTQLAAAGVLLGAGLYVAYGAGRLLSPQQTRRRV